MPEEDNPEFDRSTLRYTYTSLITPQSIFDYDLDSRERTLLKQEPVLGGYDPERVRDHRGSGPPPPTAPGCRSRW